MTYLADPDPPDDQPITPADRDQVVDAAILRLLLVEHPIQLTSVEIATELSEYGDVPGAFEDGLRRLVGAGLVHLHGRFVIPSRAARYFDRLPID